MLRAKVDLIFVVLVVVIALHIKTSTAKKEHCLPSSCGSLSNISYPFRLQTDPRGCGRRDHELACNNNRATLSLFSVTYIVKEIYYQSQTISLLDAALDEHYCAIPNNFYSYNQISPIFFYLRIRVVDTVLFLSCPTPVDSSSIVNFSTCINNSSASQSSYAYAAFGGYLADLPDSCNITSLYPITRDRDYKNLSFSYIYQKLLLGFEISWCMTGDCGYNPSLKERFHYYLQGLRYDITDTWYYLKRGEWSYLKECIGLWSGTFKIIGMLLLIRASVAILGFIMILLYIYRRRHLSMDDSIEEFLQSHNNLTPIRYSFSEIKRMTNGFKEKLGQGGYGSVFKAKLRSGHLAAIKILGKSSKTNGQDFMNEVATIGRIHHVNVVQLVGFCAERSKRALVYDFMPNGSLDKFIFSKGENKTPLSWEKMYDISLGVARGIEYLHQGCNMQILHFDIKPHNILLDVNFVPKISDFGLAKLYSTDDSIISLTAARGTLGYIAPELFYKNIGGVSYKADVYSFGMLLMEMVGRRKNVNAFAEHSSQIYFPSWIYDRVNQGEDMELGDVTEELKKLVKKMTVVALWCIQMKPVDRPSMSEVLDMLEGGSELLQMPPKPCFHPPDDPIVDHGASSSSYIDISTTS